MRAGYILFCLAILLMPLFLTAQWVNDPMLNLAVADTVNEQVTPKLAVTSDAGCYIAWFDSRGGSYAVYLQKLNALGENEWAPNGLLVSDHPQNSWITDFDLTVDASDNAVVVFNDIRNGVTADLDVFAYKIAPDGSFIWGADGICLSPAGNTHFEAAPKVTATSAGNFVFAWNKMGALETIHFQKLGADGTKLWGTDGFEIVGEANHKLSTPDVVPAFNDEVIAFWKNYTGPFYAPFTKLYTQKFAADGTALWDSAGVVIYNLGKMPGYYEPRIYSDANGGAFYTYFDAPSLSEFIVWVQHVAQDGTLVFPMNGVKATTNTQRLHLSPTLCYRPQSDELFAVWEEKNLNQNQAGIFMQKFAPDGSRQWTDDGKQLIGLRSKPISFTQGAISDSAVYIGYLENASETSQDVAVKSILVNFSGNILLSEKVLSDAGLGNKGRLRVGTNNLDQAIMVWKDERFDSGDIFAQNVNPDGTLGNPLVRLDSKNSLVPELFTLKQNFPNPFNPATTITFELTGPETVVLDVYNLSGQKVKNLIAGRLNGGLHHVTWAGKNEFGEKMSSGYYYYQMKIRGSMATRKMLLIK